MEYSHEYDHRATGIIAMIITTVWNIAFFMYVREVDFFYGLAVFGYHLLMVFWIIHFASLHRLMNTLK